MTENLIENAAASQTAPTTDGTQIVADDMMFASLGLDKVESDPNAIPDGKYDAVVVSADLVHIKSKDGVAMVITYKVTSGDYEKARISHFFNNLGTNPVIEDGVIKSYTSTITEEGKRWLKKGFVDLGIPEDKVVQTPRSALVGRECTVTVRKNGAYRNVVGVETRGNTATVAAPTEVAAPQQASAPGQFPPGF